ncbi:MAG TPA: hypothetical protein VK911_10835 [Vicinamibacterales bacterium]|nr:hypothetical protein [Vicinamibacterales bacterium]
MRAFVHVAICVSVMAGVGVPAASAQYKQYPVSQPATGERYRVEASVGLWNPSPTLLVSSESLGIVGTTVDGVADLGMEKSRFREFRVVLRPGKKHKLRFQYIPILYEAENPRLERDIIFNGIRYSVGIPVNSSLDWKAYRFSYEYDFLYRDRGFLGLVIDAKYTDVQVDLNSPVLPDPDFTKARAPIPALGLIGRIYPLGNLSLTAEFTGFKMPVSIDEEDSYDGRYVDFDVYGTLNLTNNFGVQAGYRSIDVEYRIESDTGDFALKGPYVMAVVRF